MDAEVDVRALRGRGFQPRPIEAEIGALAGTQHGIVSHPQLIARGLTAKMIRGRIRCGYLIPMHRGVYAVGHVDLTRHGRFMAAVLAGGRTAVLSHTSAAILWQLMNPFSSRPHITTATKGRRRPGIHWHAARLADDEVTTRQGIPTTTVARTLLDLASVLDSHRLERALAEAEYRGYADAPSAPELLERHESTRGGAILRRLLAAGAPTEGITKSLLEERFVQYLEIRRLERPELNRWLELGGELIEVDGLWRPQRIALELDGRASHARRARFAADRRRDRRLLASGWRPVRVAAEQLRIRREADELEADLVALGVGHR